MLPAVLLRSVRATPALLTVLLGAAACTGDTPTATPSSRALPALRDMISAGASDILASSLPLAFSPASMTAGVGDTLHFTAVGTTLSDPTVALYWYSSDAGVASVEPWTGKITAHAIGSVTIYAAAQTAGYAVASGQLTVGAATATLTQPTAPAPTTTAPMAVFPSTVALAVGDTTRLAAAGTKVTANVAVYWY